MQLLVSLAGGTADPLGSVSMTRTRGPAILFDPAKRRSVIGVEYSEPEVRDSLVMIGATVDPRSAVTAGLVTPPPWRPI